MSVHAPTSVEEVVGWVGSQLDAQEPFQVRGAATRVLEGEMPQLSLAKLDRVRFFEPDDMVVGVDAGVKVAALQDLLAERGMVLPVNPWFEGATVGGMVACNEFGPDRLERGGLRDFIIGIEYVNGEGKLVKAGGKVVKNVTGYDLGKMMLGSLGGLGVITAVHFKVAPKPTEPMIARITSPDDSWQSRLLSLHQAQLPLDFAQGLYARGQWTLALGLSGNDARRARIEADIRACFGEGVELRRHADESADSPLGRLRHRGFLSRHALGHAAHVHVTLPTAALLKTHAADSWVEGASRVVMHPIGGDLHLFYADRAQLPLQALVARAEGAGGFVHVEGSDGWTLPPSHGLSRQLKRTIDPAGIFHSPYYDAAGQGAA